MKKLNLLFTALLLLCCVGTAKAEEVTIDGIKYDVVTKGKIATVIKGSNYSGDIVIPETIEHNKVTYSVTSIGNSAFYNCTGLTSIEIPNSVTSIGNQAFRNCSSLASIRIPNSVKSIGSDAFEYCSGLTSIEIPNSVTSIGSSAFSGCSSLAAVHISNISAWCGIDFDLFQANPLYYAKNLYLNGELVTELVIPEGITSIRGSAFVCCASLTSVEIPNSVTSIGDYAFGLCTSLTSIEMPNRVTNIGFQAFCGCTSLTSIEIPNSITSIGNSAFQECTGLTSIVVAEGNTVYDSRDNCNALIETATNTLIVGCKSTVIPNSVTSIGNSAFSGCTGLTSIEIPNSVTSIGQYAFNACTDLTNVTIGESVTSIGSAAFDGTPWYNNQPEGVVYAGKVLYKYKGTMPANTSITVKDGTLGIADGAFERCTGLTSIEIPNGVTSIGHSAFRDCTDLTNIEIPNSVTSIGNYAFKGCTGLISIEIPNSVTSIGSSAFEGCTGLTSIEIPNSVTSIRFSAFNGCTGLTSIKIPNSVTSIGNFAFSGCTGLTSIVIPNSVTSIDDWYAFGGCENLKTVINLSNLTFSKGSEDYGYIAYYADKVINFPNVTIVGDWGFSTVDGKHFLAGYFGNNTDIVLPKDYNGESYAIGDYAFFCCNDLTSIEIPNSVTSIGEYAFYNCSNVKTLYIGSSITSIGDYAFAGCEKITEIKVALEKPFRGSENIFTEAVYDNATLYVSIGTEPLYQKREPWNIFFYIVEMDFTGIDEVLDEVKSESGNVKAIYDLQGRNVEGPSKGLYIINGKKVLVK